MNLEILKTITWKHIGVLIVAALVFIGIDRRTAEDVAPHIESVLESAGEELSRSNDENKTFAVLNVYDGDTLTLENGERVRLIGIDAPEIDEDEPYALESRNFLRDLLLDKRVRIESDVSERDKYERLLVYLYVDDVFINERLVESGLARARAFPPDTKFQELLDAAENRAKNARLGIWSE